MNWRHLMFRWRTPSWRIPNPREMYRPPPVSSTTAQSDVDSDERHADRSVGAVETPSGAAETPSGRMNDQSAKHRLTSTVGFGLRNRFQKFSWWLSAAREGACPDLCHRLPSRRKWSSH